MTEAEQDQQQEYEQEPYTHGKVVEQEQSSDHPEFTQGSTDSADITQDERAQ